MIGSSPSHIIFLPYHWPYPWPVTMENSSPSRDAMGWDDTDTKRPKAPALRPHRWSWDYSFPEFVLTMTDRMGHGTHKMWSCGGEIEGR